MSVINSEIYLIYEATDESFEDSDNTLHGYELIGYVETKLEADELIAYGGIIKSTRNSNKTIPVYKSQLI